MHLLVLPEEIKTINRFLSLNCSSDKRFEFSLTYNYDINKTNAAINHNRIIATQYVF